MAKERAVKVAKGIKDALSQLIREGVKDPRVTGQGLVTVTDVQLSDDLGIATVYISVIGGNLEEVTEGLMQARGYLQIELGKRLSMKRPPKLKIASAKTVVKAQRLERLFAEIESERMNKAKEPKS